MKKKVNNSVSKVLELAGLGRGHHIKSPFVMSQRAAKTRYAVSVSISLLILAPGASPEMSQSNMVITQRRAGRPELWLVYSETFKILSHSQ